MPGDKAATKGHGVSLLDQHRLAIAGMSDMRLSSGDKAVLGIVIERYRRDSGGSRVSYSYITLKTGLSRRSAIDCVRRLVDRGYISVRVPGAGTRPAEYLPNWSAAVSSEADLTTTSGEADFTTVVNHASPLGALEVKPTSPIPTYVPGLQPADDKEEPELTPGAAPAPALAGGPGAPRGPGGFDELWGTYGVKRDKAKARAAYEKLAPDAALHAGLLAGAERWRDAYDEQCRAAKYRKALHTWLAGEQWDCDPDEAPASHKASQPSSKPKPASQPKRAEPSSQPVGGADPNGPASAEVRVRTITEVVALPGAREGEEWPDGPVVVTVDAAEVYDYDGEKDLAVFLHTDRKLEVFHSFPFQAADGAVQEAGHRMLSEICRAVGLTEIEDSEELVGRRMLVELDAHDRIKYAPPPTPANDNSAQEEKAA